MESVCRFLLGGDFPLITPGLCYRDSASGLFLTHGHLFDIVAERHHEEGGLKLRLSMSSVFNAIRTAAPGATLPQRLLRELRQSENLHVRLGKLYEFVCRLFADAPACWRWSLDHILADKNVAQQVKACSLLSASLECTGVVVGHIHELALRQYPEQRAFCLNPGTLTSAFKIHPSALQCMFACVIHQENVIRVELVGNQNNTFRLLEVRNFPTNGQDS